MKRYGLYYLLAAVALLAGRVGAAASESASGQVRVKLIAAADAVQPGGTVLLGAHFRLLPHWHIYWKNPGDSGVATSIDYLLPAGSTAGSLQWPAPAAIRFGPVINYGYENEVTLLSSIHIPGHAEIGTDFPVKAKLKWLVCKESCIPQEADLELRLPVVSPVKSYDNGNRLIAAALASLPRAIDAGDYSVHRKGGDLVLRVGGSRLPAPPTQARFFPDDWGPISQSADQPWQTTGDGLSLTLRQGDEPLPQGGALKGVLVLSGADGRPGSKRSYRIHAVVAAAAGGAPQSGSGLAAILATAFLGGLILNLMPCVFPVLSLKTLGFIQQARLDPRQVKLQGWVYTAGVLTGFAALSGLFYGLRSAGEAVGWGFQFQSPPFVLFSAYLMFGVGLSLSGVFTVGASIAGAGDRLVRRSGYAGSFFTGTLATVVATPCTAPFMATALGFAVTQPAHVFFAVFFSLGFGLALPYLLLSQWPAAFRRFLPKPGAWMERFKQILALPMYAASIWLLWVLARQIGVKALPLSLAGLAVLALAAWLYESAKSDRFRGRESCLALVALLLGVAAFGGYFATRPPLSSSALPSPTLASAYEDSAFEPYSEVRLRELRGQGKAVFVNLTASWCVSCLVNEKVALSRQSVRDFFKRRDITYLKGDWTNGDEEITRLLDEFGRGGVPLYVFYPAAAGRSVERTSAQPVVLPQILTPDLITRTLAAVMPAVAGN